MHATGLGVEHLVERQRIHLAVNKADDGAVFVSVGRKQEFHRRIAEVACVFGVEGNRVGAAQFIAEVFVNESHFDAEFFEAMVIADDFSEAFKLAFGQRRDEAFFTKRLNQAFRKNDETVARAFDGAFDDGADDDVADFVHGDGPVAKFLGDD